MRFRVEFLPERDRAQVSQDTTSPIALDLWAMGAWQLTTQASEQSNCRSIPHLLSQYSWLHPYRYACKPSRHSAPRFLHFPAEQTINQ